MIDTVLRWRSVAHEWVTPGAWRREGLSPVNQALVGTVVLAVLAQVLETEPLMLARHGEVFHGLNLFLAGVFSLDFLARFWVSGEEPRYQGWRGRLRYLLQPGALLDLVAILPFYLYPFIEFLDANDLAFLRLALGVKVVRAARMGRVTLALRALHKAVSQRREELELSLLVACVVILISATLLYWAEREAQPGAFGSIPRALWWSVTTFTTVGYGDVVPVTPLGKVLAALAGMLGVGVIAIPTGILAAAFSDAFREEKRGRGRHGLDGGGEES